MNEDEIETRLRQLGQAMEPPASMASEVMRRIEGQFAPQAMEHRPHRAHRIYRAAAFFVGAAACVAGLLVALYAGRGSAPRPPIAVVPTTQTNAPEGADPAPRFVDYQDAYSHSAEAFEALLQQRPTESVGSSGHEFRVADSLRPDFNLYQ